MGTKILAYAEIPAAEAIVRVLEESGIDTVFGMPGGNSMLIYDALYDHREQIRTVPVRHESLAGVMAEVYGRLTGKPGVAMGQGLFMLSNALLGVIEAHLGSAPMLVMTDTTDGAPFSQHAPYQSGTGEYGTWNGRAAFSAVTKLTLESHLPAQAVHHTQTAVSHALSGSPGPVALLYHSAALKGRVGPETVPRLYARRPAAGFSPPPADPASVDQAAGALEKARRPAIIAGNGVRTGRAESRLLRLAERLGAPVATTSAGKGVFPEDHALALGVFGTFGLPFANACIAEADLLLVVGSKLAPSDTAFENPGLIDPMRQTVIQIDIEPRNIGISFPCEAPLAGDAGTVLRQLEEALDESGRGSEPGRGGWRHRLKALKEIHGCFDEPEYASDKLPMLPQRIVSEIRKGLPDDAMVTCDAGENRLFMTRFFQTRGKGIFLSPASTGGMGYAIPAALACRLIHPGRPAVAVCGDGGFAMSMNGLLTALEENLPIVVVVLNNRALGWVKHFQKDRVIASELSDVNAAEIARATGCRGFRADNPHRLAEAMAEALRQDRPAVVDVVTTIDVSYRDILSPLAAS